MFGVLTAVEKHYSVPTNVKARERFGSRIMARRRINQSIIIVTNIREKRREKVKQ